MSEAPSEDTVIHLADIRDKSKVWAMLAKTDKGAPLPTLSNVLIILRHDPVLAGIVTLNEFAYETAITRAPPAPDTDAPLLPGPYPRPWTEADEALILAYIQRRWMAKASDKALSAAMNAEAAMRGFHPVREWLDSLEWDGHKRLDTWLIRAFGCTDDNYHRDVAAKFLIAAVRRIRQPGCKFDFMPVFEGDQGIGKSTVIKTLFSPEWFSDSMPRDLGHKDAAIGLLGIWCVEMAEIDTLIRSEVETIKAFLSRGTDKYRPPYGKRDVIRDRQGVICGTTNAKDYLRDTTGNRRFWPIPCSFANVEWIADNREQLWAEAVIAEKTGEPIWLEDAEVQTVAQSAQEDRIAEDTWHEKIAVYILGRTQISTSELLVYCLDIPVKDHERRLLLRVAAILRQLDWWVKVVREGQAVTRLWFHPDLKNGSKQS